MIKYTIQPIGYVKNEFNDIVKMPDIKKVKDGISIIEVLDEYSEGLFKIEEQEFLNIIFYFDKSEKEYNFICNTPMGEERGVFACRSPKRPNSLGTTTVKLVKREGNKLFVTGFDAINNTPVIDIKNANTPLLETNPTYVPRYQENPRIDIETLLDKKHLKGLLIKASQLHNHFCPGLTLGVMASSLAMFEAKKIYGDYKGISASVETTTCFMDGVQFVTGCTVANKLLKVENTEQTAVTIFNKKQPEIIRVQLKSSTRDYIKNNFPEFSALKEKLSLKKEKTTEDIVNIRALALEAAFKIVALNPENLFELIVEVPVLEN